jgi:ABC-type amino acid transport substrate-binding protein
VIIRILVAILAAISMVSCSGEHKSAASEPISDPQEYRFTLSPDEQRYVDEELGGSLLIYTRDRESVFEPDKYGPDEHGGFEFEMAKLLAGVLSLELEYRLVDDFSEYFARDGSVPDAATLEAIGRGEMPAYTPDPLREARILVDGFGYRLWREKLATLVPTIPDRNVVISRRGEDISKLRDLEGLRIASFPTASHYQTLLSELRAEEIDFIPVIAEDTGELAEMVSSGQADAMSSGGISALFELGNYSNLNIAFAIGGEVSFSHWLIRSDDEVLAEILKRFFQWALVSGEYGKVWGRQFGYPLENFLEIIGALPE